MITEFEVPAQPTFSKEFSFDELEIQAAQLDYRLRWQRGNVLIPIGTELIFETYYHELLDYREAELEQSEYIGGFFPPNPFFPHNVTGGYGIFTIIEKDTVVLR